MAAEVHFPRPVELPDADCARYSHYDILAPILGVHQPRHTKNQ